jgi:hypothetical protein
MALQITVILRNGLLSSVRERPDLAVAQLT